MRGEPDPLIEKTAIHMSEAGATWPKMTPSLREGWRYLAQRAVEVLRPGKETHLSPPCALLGQRVIRQRPSGGCRPSVTTVAILSYFCTRRSH
jgi:hypothetical protein